MDVITMLRKMRQEVTDYRVEVEGTRREAHPQIYTTLAHELAHHFSGATQPSPEEETIAESTAYVVCARFGLDTGEVISLRGDLEPGAESLQGSPDPYSGD
jgi:hypothetical protein